MDKISGSKISSVFFALFAKEYNSRTQCVERSALIFVNRANLKSHSSQYRMKNNQNFLPNPKIVTITIMDHIGHSLLATHDACDAETQNDSLRLWGHALSFSELCKNSPIIPTV